MIQEAADQDGDGKLNPDELRNIADKLDGQQHYPSGGWPQASDYLSVLEANPSDYETLDKLMNMIRALGAPEFETMMAMDHLYYVEDAQYKGTEAEKEEAVDMAISYVRDAFLVDRRRRAKEMGTK
jgi:hypothetical protein